MREEKPITRDKVNFARNAIGNGSNKSIFLRLMDKWAGANPLYQER